VQRHETEHMHGQISAGRSFLTAAGSKRLELKNDRTTRILMDWMMTGHRRAPRTRLLMNADINAQSLSFHADAQRHHLQTPTLSYQRISISKFMCRVGLRLHHAKAGLEHLAVNFEWPCLSDRDLGRITKRRTLQIIENPSLFIDIRFFSTPSLDFVACSS
jgi:hypothetical protein